MLRLQLKSVENYTDEDGFYEFGGMVVELEHSLATISQWESKWKIPFLSTEMNPAQYVDYIRTMCQTEDVPESAWLALTREQHKQIREYMVDTLSATKVTRLDQPQAHIRKKIITSEVIYGWMVSLGIPFECQYWHLSRLLMLIEVVSTQKAPKKKMGAKEAAKMQRDMNAARRAKYGTKG